MAIDVVTNEIAANLEEVASATRGINTSVVSAFTGGAVFGAILGFYFGYRFNREKIKAEVFKDSQEEVTEIRKAYREEYSRGSEEPVHSGVGANRVEKPSVEEIVAAKGYVNREEADPGERPLRPPVPILPQPLKMSPESVVTEPQEVEPLPLAERISQWNYAREKSQRDPNFPYIIHEDEFTESQMGYDKTTYTYYASDNVLVDTDDKPLSNVNNIVGLGNLRFGHGSEDPDTVFIRNDKIALEMEITRVPRSYEEDVLGHDLSDKT